VTSPLIIVPGNGEFLRMHRSCGMLFSSRLANGPIQPLGYRMISRSPMAGDWNIA
jgi:hypothetical protein